MHCSRKLLFPLIFLLLNLVAHAASIQIGTVQETTNSASNFTVVTSNSTNRFANPFLFSITEIFTDVTGSTLTAGPFSVAAGGSVTTNVGHSNAEQPWIINGQLQPSGISQAGDILLPDSNMFTVTGGFAPIGESLTVPILISGTLVPEPKQSLLIALAIIWILAFQSRRRTTLSR